MSARPSLAVLFASVFFSALCAAPAAAQIRVALCAAASASNTACQWTDVQTKLLATNQFSVVDILNVGTATPTLAQLSAYDALLCWTNTTPLDTNAWGNVLADYVDAGGGVVVAVFANSSTTTNRWIGGRWQNGYEVVLDRGGSTTGAGAGLGTVAQPSHPVMLGLAGFTGGSVASRPTSTALEVGSSLIASWTDGKVLVAEGSRRNRIDLGFYPPSTACSSSGWAIGGDVLMANALNYVALSGTLFPYGVGCSGSLGTPTLLANAASRPVAGGSLSLTVGNMPLGVGLVSIGFSDVQNGPFALPYDLAPFGMLGCNLLAEVVSTQLVIGAGTSANWSLALPAFGSFVGLHFYCQAFVIDGAANPAGLTTSNATRARIGY